AGFIPPITGNGMSLAFRGALNLFQTIVLNSNTNDFANLNKLYTQKYLNTRIKKGIFLQDLLLIKNKFFNKALMYSLANVPGLLPLMTRQAVGKMIGE
ncbi:MAG TPA: hypothetical protein PKD85_23510, partial [Saprospiraceae bacterium]|nr:hypothetical protein [Saprospiraceae bacterium]